MAAGTITTGLHSTQLIDNSLKNNNLASKLVKNLNSPNNGSGVIESSGKSTSKDGVKHSSTGKKRARATDSSPELMRCKRRISFTSIGSSSSSEGNGVGGYNLPAPTSVARRNERERNRVKLVNMGFATLRDHVPNGSKNKKMSKVDTLRSAVEYIRKLQQLLDDEEDDDESFEEEENSGEARNISGGSTSDVGSPYTDSAIDSPAISSTENLPPIYHIHQLHLPTQQLHNNHHHHNNHNHHHHHRNVHHHNDNFNGNNNNNNNGNVQCPPASVSPTCSISSSPSPSHASDYSSYEPLSPEEEDLLDFTSWFT
ncbi:achaete-scute complex 2 [Chamberlinius hualienensis]